MGEEIMFLSKERKVPGKRGTLGKEQRCTEDIWGCLTMYIPCNFRFSLHKTAPVKPVLFINIFRVSLWGEENIKID